MKPTRLYLQKSNNDFSRILWFHNNKVNEMLLGIYGLTKKQPTLTLEFPEHILANTELDAIRYNYSEAVEINKQLDHITCHCDGKFHLKTKSALHFAKSSDPIGLAIEINKPTTVKI